MEVVGMVLGVFGIIAFGQVAALRKDLEALRIEVGKLQPGLGGDDSEG